MLAHVAQRVKDVLIFDKLLYWFQIWAEVLQVKSCVEEIYLQVVVFYLQDWYLCINHVNYLFNAVCFLNDTLEDVEEVLLLNVRREDAYEIHICVWEVDTYSVGSKLENLGMPALSLCCSNHLDIHC